MYTRHSGALADFYDCTDRFSHPHTHSLTCEQVNCTVALFTSHVFRIAAFPTGIKHGSGSILNPPPLPSPILQYSLEPCENLVCLSDGWFSDSMARVVHVLSGASRSGVAYGTMCIISSMSYTNGNEPHHATSTKPPCSILDPSPLDENLVELHFVWKHS